MNEDEPNLDRYEQDVARDHGEVIGQGLAADEEIDIENVPVVDPAHVEELKLRYLYSLVENDNKEVAARLVGGRRSLVVDNDWILNPKAPQYMMVCPEVKLDLMYIGPKKMGLGAVFLTRDTTQHDWELTFEADFTFLRTWSAKRVDTGFDTDGRSFYFGRTPDDGHVWIFFLPKPDGDINADFNFHAPRMRRKATKKRMDTINSRKFLCFLIFCLSKMGHQSVAMWEDYPDVDELAAARIATNYM